MEKSISLKLQHFSGYILIFSAFVWCVVEYRHDDIQEFFYSFQRIIYVLAGTIAVGGLIAYRFKHHVDFVFVLSLCIIVSIASYYPQVKETRLKNESFQLVLNRGLLNYNQYGEDDEFTFPKNILEYKEDTEEFLASSAAYNNTVREYLIKIRYLRVDDLTDYYVLSSSYNRERVKNVLNETDEVIENYNSVVNAYWSEPPRLFTRAGFSRYGALKESLTNWHEKTAFVKMAHQQSVANSKEIVATFRELMQLCEEDSCGMKGKHYDARANFQKAYTEPRADLIKKLYGLVEKSHMLFSQLAHANADIWRRL